MNSSDTAPRIIEPRRIRHSYTQSIDAAPDEVFPLLCPVREMDWVSGWRPDWVISASGLAEQDCVFQTPGDASAGTAPAIWVVTVYCPEEHHIEILKVIPAHTVTKLVAKLRADGTNATRATVSYEYTALGAQGDRFLEQCTEDWYRQMMREWETSMNAYLVQRAQSG